MIKDIEMKDFISHKDTRLEFGKGITIFVGHNGSGKSSVIDAITFALFGEHTRKSNKNLVRRAAGASQAAVRMRFMLNAKEYQATRSVSVAGSSTFSQLELLSEGGRPVNKKIAGGERRQYGESMSAEVAKVLGLDYKKLRVAAVVQQGELVKIVEAQPREFKELLNGLIGIDRLDSAFSTMKDVISGFRERLRAETGYSDEDMPRVQKLVIDKKAELAQAESLLAEYEEEKKLLQERMARLDREIERLEPLILHARDLATKEEFLLRHLRERRSQLETEVAKMGRTVAEASSALAVVQGKGEVEARLRTAHAKIEELQAGLVENEGQAGRLRGLLECAGRLQVTDGTCPVCGSHVKKVNEMFDTSHIHEEIEKKAREREDLQASRVELVKQERVLAEQDKKIAAAARFLADNSVGSESDVERMQEELATKKAQLAKLPQVMSRVDDPLTLAVDGQSQSLAVEITALREVVRGFSQSQYSNAKLEKTNLSDKLLDASRKAGSCQRAIDDARGAIDSAEKALAYLEQASGFVAMLETIRSHVYNRDGAVSDSLRSWVRATVSKKASEYASLFNIGISRVELAEKARDIAITCYGKSGEVEMDSLSGGEKVAVALALRLGIAYVMGSGRLDFVILDEPTTHLDEERRKALVRIISEAFGEGVGPLAQMVIITHDSDIFEDSEVDAVFRFTMTTEGTRVTRE